MVLNALATASPAGRVAAAPRQRRYPRAVARLSEVSVDGEHGHLASETEWWVQRGRELPSSSARFCASAGSWSAISASPQSLQHHWASGYWSESSVASRACVWAAVLRDRGEEEEGRAQDEGHPAT